MAKFQGSGFSFEFLKYYHNLTAFLKTLTLDAAFLSNNIILLIIILAP